MTSTLRHRSPGRGSRSRRGALWAGIGVLAAASFVAGIASGPLAGAASVATAIATPTDAATAAPRASTVGSVSDRYRTCSVASLVDGWSAGTLEVEARSVTTNEVLLAHKAKAPAATASNMKVLTMAAAVASLGPTDRIDTTVVKGAAAGSVVLVGGGDPTLSRLPTGQTSFYTGAAHLDDLAAQVKAAWAADPQTAGTAITTVDVDATLFGGTDYLPSWEESERTEGYQPKMTALMVDGDRDDPASLDSPRSTDPVGRAASAFAALLGANVTVVTGQTAPAGATTLGTVQSPTIAHLADLSLLHSDNTIAEALARLVAIDEGAGNTFAAIQKGTTAALKTYGIPTKGLVLVDGSGLSDLNRVTPDYLTRLMVKIARGDQHLGVVYRGLPVAGETGTLDYSDRFVGANAVARGHIHAKTGYIKTAFALSGVTDPVSGTRVAFTIWAENTGDQAAKSQIDSLATAIWQCGGNLADW